MVLAILLAVCSDVGDSLSTRLIAFAGDVRSQVSSVWLDMHGVLDIEAVHAWISVLSVGVDRFLRFCCLRCIRLPTGEPEIYWCRRHQDDLSDKEEGKSLEESSGERYRMHSRGIQKFSARPASLRSEGEEEKEAQANLERRWILTKQSDGPQIVCLLYLCRTINRRGYVTCPKHCDTSMPKMSSAAGTSSSVQSGFAMIRADVPAVQGGRWATVSTIGALSSEGRNWRWRCGAAHGRPMHVGASESANVHSDSPIRNQPPWTYVNNGSECQESTASSG